jgi:predicted kinase
MKLNLVVFTGYAGSGKSTISKYLAETGFKSVNSEDFLGKEDIWGSICNRRDSYLQEGSDVVIDTTSYNNKIRQRLLSSKCPCEKYLIWIKADDSIRKERIRTRPATWGKLGYEIEGWKKMWEDPKSGKEYTLLEYENNTPQDLEFIKSDLKRRLIK